MWESIPEDGNLMEEKYPYVGEKCVPISQAFPIRWISLHFLMLWEIDGETHAFHKL